MIKVESIIDLIRRVDNKENEVIHLLETDPNQAMTDKNISDDVFINAYESFISLHPDKINNEESFKKIDDTITESDFNLLLEETVMQFHEEANDIMYDLNRHKLLSVRQLMHNKSNKPSEYINSLLHDMFKPLYIYVDEVYGCQLVSKEKYDKIELKTIAIGPDGTGTTSDNKYILNNMLVNEYGVVENNLEMIDYYKQYILIPLIKVCYCKFNIFLDVNCVRRRIVEILRSVMSTSK